MNKRDARFGAFTVLAFGSATAATLLGLDWFFAGFAYGVVVGMIVAWAAVGPGEEPAQ